MISRRTFPRKDKKFLALFGLLVMLFSLAYPISGASAADVAISDSRLKSCINDQLSQSAEASISNDQALSLSSLQCSAEEVKSLGGLEKFTNLETLELVDNQITDISPLGQMSKLKNLYLFRNKVSDTAALKNLKNLVDIDISENQVTDISSLSGLVKLNNLTLGDNRISDISVVKNFSELVFLGLANNSVTDISPLTVLSNLTRVALGSNKITDVSALASMNKLEGIGLENNRISDLSSLKDLRQTNIGAADQKINLPALPTGEEQLSPLKGTFGATVPVKSQKGSAVTTKGGTAWKYQEAGTNELSWNTYISEGRGTNFSGVITQESSGSPVKVPSEEQEVAPEETVTPPPSVATQNPTASESATAEAQSADPTSNSNGNFPLMIAGIVALLLVVIGIIWVILRNRKKKGTTEADSTPTESE